MAEALGSAVGPWKRLLDAAASGGSNIIPKPLKADQLHQEAALTTPLGVTGTPKELDEPLSRQLVEFVESHLVHREYFVVSKVLLAEASR